MNAPVLIKPDGDLGAVLKLIRVAFAEQDGLIEPPSSMNTLTVLDILKHLETDVVWGLYQGPQLVACLFGTDQGDVFYLSKLSVHPDARGRGIATGLMTAAGRYAHAAGFKTLEVIARVELAGNHAMFEAMGYALYSEGRHAGYDRTTELHFRKAL